MCHKFLHRKIRITEKSCFYFLFGIVIGLIPLFITIVHNSPNKINFLNDSFIERSSTLPRDGQFQYFIGSDELNALAAHLLPPDTQYYYNYTCYDFYSTRDIGQSKPQPYWEKFSLDTLEHYPQSVKSSGLAFVESIIVVTDKCAASGEKRLEKVFLRQGIQKSTIEYHCKWNTRRCQDPNNSEHIKSKFLYVSNDHSKNISCSAVTQHVDAWYSIAKRNLSFALILEEDMVFVPFLKEKFNRFISEAVKLHLIKVSNNQNDCASFSDEEDYTISQMLKTPILTEGVFHFGKCTDIINPHITSNNLKEVPRFIPYRNYSNGHCAHMYGMTHCAAKMMIKTLSKFPRRSQCTGRLINQLITNSPKLIGWWTDPPLGYPASKIDTIGKLDPFLKQSS